MKTEATERMTGPSQLTQPATQLVTDPRRLGQPGSGLSDDQLADVFCILHPATLPACHAAALIRVEAPENTIDTHSNVKIREKNSSEDEFNASQLAQDGLESCDIALRLTCRLKDPMGGFQFGRNTTRCDFVLGKYDITRRISNIHFRIYINEYGVIMLEDQSTNGTAIDGILLRGKEKENGREFRHTLSQGSVITLTMTPPEEDYRFIVRIPQREGDVDVKFQENLTAYFLRMTNLRGKDIPRTVAGSPARGNPLNLFPKTQEDVTPDHFVSSVGRRVREWRGGHKYNKIGTIGKGAFAIVYKITAKFDGVPYAAKELEKRRFMKNGILDQQVENEMRIMQRIKHPNIVQYIEHVDWEEYLYIIMEFVPGGDLGSLVGTHGKLPEDDVKIMTRQLLSALKYLHQDGITHRDIKPDNILIQRRRPFHVKLTDFGLSKMITGEDTFLRTFCGTLLYCAPEVYSEYREYDAAGRRNFRGKDKRSLPPQRYGHAVDIWSLAGVLFYSLCREPPYPVQNGTSYQELLNQIMTGVLDVRPLQHANVSNNGIQFVKSMLQRQPQSRATIDQLEGSPWLLGDDSFEVSMDEDEVALISDGLIDSELEEGTAQLSIYQNDYEVDECDEMIDDNLSDMAEMQQREIPSSFITSEGGDGSYGFLEGSDQPTNGRLFGEVNVSAVGSSGAIPMNHLNLPLPLAAANHQSMLSDSSWESTYTQSHHANDVRTHSNPPLNAAVPRIMYPADQDPRHPENDGRTVRSSSLIGAESMVGHLNMQSPASATSPGEDGSPASATEEIRDTTISIRRPREEEYDEDGNWKPADLPSKRRRKSKREIDIPIPPSTFWDPKDKATHHNNYPRMLTSDFRAYQDFAESKGEKFIPGQKTFEVTMESLRSSSSRSASVELERAHSEPTKEAGRRMLMKRDDRRLASNGSIPDKGAPRTGQAEEGTRDDVLPWTARPSQGPTMVAFKPTPPPNYPQPVVGNDFEPPKRILAKLVSTLDSRLPTISLNIIDSVTSWGRGYEATLRYANGQEIRIPKYAFKIFLFKPGFYAHKQPTIQTKHVWHAEDPDMKFYISTKASFGIWVNGVNVPCHERQEPRTESKYWGELKYDDIITIWQAPGQQIRLKFECYWGKSKEVRKANNPFQILPQGKYLDELDATCLVEENAILDNMRRREQEEKEREKRVKLAR